MAVNDATVKFEIWDTAGQERYHSLAPMYYRGAAAAIIVYDISNQVSKVANTTYGIPSRQHLRLQKAIKVRFILYTEVRKH